MKSARNYIQNSLKAVCSIIAVCAVLLSVQAHAQTPFTSKKVNTKRMKVLWDGDTIATGRSWVSTKDTYRDSARFKILNKDEIDRANTHMQFSVAGEQYMGFGWNWLDRWETHDGTDLRKFKYLSFKLKIAGQKLPEHYSDISFQLAGGGSPKVSRSKAYSVSQLTQENVFSGEWHQIKVPLSQFINTKNKNLPALNGSLVREFSIGVTPRDYVDFDIFIDDVAVTK